MAQASGTRPRNRRSWSETTQTDFSQPFDGSDVTFVLDGQEVHAAKAVLKLASERFKGLLHKVKDGEKVHIPGIRHQDFCQLMDVLHPTQGRQKPLSEGVIYKLLPLIEHYEINGILDQCEDILMKKPPDLRHLAIAKEHKFTDLEQKTISWASKQTLSSLKQNPDWGIVEEKQRLKILEQIITRHESKNETKISSDHEKVTGVKQKQSSGGSTGGHTQDRNCLNEICQTNRTLVHNIHEIIDGKVHGVGSLQPCNSMSHTHHYKGSKPNCVNCRSEMIVRIRKCLYK